VIRPASNRPASGPGTGPSRRSPVTTRPQEIMASQQAVNAMQRAIEALPATLRDVLILRNVEGVEAKEVCEMLKITETNLYVRLHRARERVRVAVETALG
jgi:RNA polymerase sigma-70 factor, ECF subfamily